MIKISQREKAPSNETPTLMKSMNMNIRVNSIQFIKSNWNCSETETNFEKNKAVTGSFL